jgi:hypothetical protein
MKTLLAGLCLATAGLAGCVAVPVAEPGVYVAPPPPAAVVVRPAPRYYGYYGYRHYRRW